MNSQNGRKHISVTAARRQRETEAHRQAILAAAEKVFGEVGYERTTMEEVARRAEFSVGALYRFFPSKAVLFREVLVGIVREFREAASEVIEKSGRSVNALRAVVALEFQKMQEHGAFFRTVVEFNPGTAFVPDAALIKECHRLYDGFIEELASLFRQALKETGRTGLDSRYLALALEGVIHAFSAYWHRKGLDLPVQQRADYVWRTFLKPILSPGGLK